VPSLQAQRINDFDEDRIDHRGHGVLGHPERQESGGNRYADDQSSRGLVEPLQRHERDALGKTGRDHGGREEKHAEHEEHRSVSE